MTTGTLVLIFLSVFAAAALSYFQYFFRSGPRQKISYLLAALRFVSVLAILLLLINPVISRNNIVVEKAPLALVLDNSGSVKALGADKTAAETFRKLSTDSRLKDKFDVQPYQFDAEFGPAATPDFKGRQSDLEAVARNLQSINKNKVFPTVLITDGNQTRGNDFVFAFDRDNKVLPVVLGDTTAFPDLRVIRVNANKYAYRGNQFPVEVFLQYSGNKAVSGNFEIRLGGGIVHKERVDFSPSKKSAVLNFLLPAEKSGIQVYRAVVNSSEKEKNTVNNALNFAVEVMDQRTEVTIVASLNHPDLGALKRSIESNAQRKVTIVKPADLKSPGDYNVLVLYQPDASFKPVYQANQGAKVNTLTITGNNTDFAFLGQQQDIAAFKMSGQKEDYLADYNPQFGLFSVEDIGFAAFPPLENSFGTIKVSAGVSVLLSSRIRNIATGQPLLCFSENAGRRSAFLFGEGIWKWRLQSHVENRSYAKFDLFLDKTIQYLASDNARKRLVVSHERFYHAGDAIAISAQYFDKNYEFDPKARLSISVTGKDAKVSRRYDMLRGTSDFKTNLDGLPAGHYNFTVRELNSNTAYSGGFEIMDFDIEKQFAGPDVQRLRQLAANTGGALFLPGQTDALIQKLLADPTYKAVQKTIAQKTPLIDWMWLLVLLALTLSAEWLLRKYHGML